MSEVAESTAAEPVAAVVEAPAEPVQPTTAGQENLTPRDKVREMGRKMDKARSESARKADQARDQHREDGKFATETTDEVAATAATDEPVSESEPTPEAGSAAQESDGGPAEGFERVMYPDGHPLRDQGVEFEDVPVKLAPKFKALLNGTYARRHDVEQAERRAMEAEQRALRIEAEARFHAEHGSEFWTPEDQAFYEDAKEKYGAEFAEAYKLGKKQAQDAKLTQVREEADLKALSLQWQTNGQQFRSEAHDTLPRIMPGLTATEIDTAIGMYRAELEQVENMAWQEAQRKGIPHAQFARQFAQRVGYSGDDFFAVTKAYLESRPGVIARRQDASQASQVEHNRIKAQVEAAEREKLKEASTRHAANPNRNLAGASPPRNVEPEPTESLVGKPMGEIKRDGKRRFLEKFRESRGV